MTQNLSKNNSEFTLLIFKFGFLFGLLAFVHQITLITKNNLVIITELAKEVPRLSSETFIPKLIIFILFSAAYRYERLNKFFYFFCFSYIVFYGYCALLGISQDVSSTPVWLVRSIYIAPDIWRDVTLLLVFWVSANQVFTLKKAAIVYPSFAVIGAASFGITSVFFGKYLTHSPNLSLLMAATGIFVMGIIYSRIHSSSVITVTEPPETHSGEYPKFFVISMIFLITISASLVFESADILIKTNLSDQFSTSIDYRSFMSEFVYFKSILVFIIALLSSSIICFFGWRTAALIPPVVILVIGSFYSWSLFTPLTFENSYFPSLSAFIAVALNTFIAGVYGTLYQSTKQMAYIPLASKTKARALGLIDFLLGGKIIASGLIFTLFVSETDFEFLTITLSIVAFIFCFVWILSTLGLAKKLKANAHSI